jgi:hypothetical protein
VAALLETPERWQSERGTSSACPTKQSVQSVLEAVAAAGIEITRIELEGNGKLVIVSVS